MANILLYYSVNTKLAHHINEAFYQGKHYVWCAPIFDPTKAHAYSPFANIPPSSSPHDIYCLLRKDVNKKDDHSYKIKDNRRGLKKGAAHMLKEGKISEEQFGDIVKLIKSASFQDFMPYIYLIREDMVKNRIEQVPVRQTANPMGVEFRIADLDSSEFEIIEVAAL